jgi:hypothetical protein
VELRDAEEVSEDAVRWLHLRKMHVQALCLNRRLRLVVEAEAVGAAVAAEEGSRRVSIRCD